LRYANRVKGLSKSNNLKKDQSESSLSLPPKDLSLSPPLPLEDARDFSNYNQTVANIDDGRRSVDNPQYYNQYEELGRYPSSLSLSYDFTNREESWFSSMVENNRVNMREGIVGPVTSQKSSSAAMNSFDRYRDEKVHKVSPTRRKVSREEKPDK
jgi:kinesin family protein 2/24